METVRGSTHRGATAALKSLLTPGKGRSLAITPDGPRVPDATWHLGASIYPRDYRFP